MDLPLVIGPGHLVGVEACRMEDGTVRFHWAHLRRRRDGIHLVRHGSCGPDVNELKNAIGPRHPITLVITGERVLLRTLPGEFDPVRDLGKAMPNARAADMAIGHAHVEGHALLGITRQDLLGPLLESLCGHGLRVMSVFIGPWPLLHLLDRSVTSPLTAGAHRFTQGPDGWQHEAMPTATDLTIGDEVVPGIAALAFGAAWAHWFHPESACTPEHPLVARSKGDERARLWYERGLVALVATLLVLLATDLLIRHALGAQEGGLRMAIAERDREQAELDSLERAAQEKQQLIRSAGLGRTGQMLHVLDRIAGSTPPAVVLSECWYAPAAKPIRPGEPFERRSGIVTLTGQASDPAALAAWVTHLQTIEGIRHARLRALNNRPLAEPVFHIELGSP